MYRMGRGSAAVAAPSFRQVLGFTAVLALITLSLLAKIKKADKDSVTSAREASDLLEEQPAAKCPTSGISNQEEK